MAARIARKHAPGCGTIQKSCAASAARPMLSSPRCHQRCEPTIASYRCAFNVSDASAARAATTSKRDAPARLRWNGCCGAGYATDDGAGLPLGLPAGTRCGRLVGEWRSMRPCGSGSLAVVALTCLSGRLALEHNSKRTLYLSINCTK
jgi:hypothetical protein